jgi:hypothetical protein
MVKRMDLKQLSEKTRDVLLLEWDPLGVGSEPAAQDEYDAYVGPIARMVHEGRSAAELAEYLVEIETELVDRSNRDRARRVADRLRLLRPGG